MAPFRNVPHVTDVLLMGRVCLRACCCMQLIALVQRCKCEQQQHEAVRSLAQGLLTRWRGQLAGHMQVGLGLSVCV